MPVNEKKLEYDRYLPVWESVRDCVLGQQRVKYKGTTYLPDFSIKDEARYSAYKERAMFLGVTQRTLSSLVGAAMRKAPEVTLPPSMDYLIEDADNSGNSLNQLFRSTIYSMMGVGRHGLLTDYPSSEGQLTVEEVSRLGLRPMIKEYRAENIINWREDKGQLVLVVLLEWVQKEKDEFTIDEEERYRVLRMVDGVYIQEMYDEGGMFLDTRTPRKADGTTWGEIPFVFAGSMNNSPDIDTAPMYDLAVVNIAHYRNSADYEEGVFLHGQPMLHIDIGNMNTSQWKDLNPNGIQVGARRGITTSGGGSAQLLQAEPNSAAFEAMEHKEKQMMKLGARLVEAGGANETAEAARIDAAAEHSVLSSVVVNAGEAIRLSIQWACMFAGSDAEEVEVIMNTEFFDKLPDAQMIAAMMGLEDRTHMAKTDIRSYLRKVGLIESDRTDEDIEEELDTDAGVNINDVPPMPPANQGDAE